MRIHYFVLCPLYFTGTNGREYLFGPQSPCAVYYDPNESTKYKVQLAILMFFVPRVLEKGNYKAKVILIKTYLIYVPVIYPLLLE